MDGLRIGAWTRRRFSQIIGALPVSLLGLGAVAETEARRRRKDRDRDRDKDKDKDRKKKRKKRRKRDRCVKLARTCSQTGTECCNRLDCEDFGRPTGFRCCRPAGLSCSTNRDDECCPDLECINGVCDFGP
jgi:hypothetical protein